MTARAPVNVPRNAGDADLEVRCTLLRRDRSPIAERRITVAVRNETARKIWQGVDDAMKNWRQAGGWPNVFAHLSRRALRAGRIADAQHLASLARASYRSMDQTGYTPTGTVAVDTRPYMIGTVLHGVSERSTAAVAHARLEHTRSSRVDLVRAAGLRAVSRFGWYGLPADRRMTLLSNRGEKRQKLLFLDVNFNYPPFRQWLSEHMPERLRSEYGDGEGLLALCVSNEFAYWAPGYYDYSPWTVEKYRKWLAEKYGAIEGLNRAWRSRHESFQAIEPPRDIPTTDMANWIDWRVFTCWNFSEFFRYCADITHQVLPGVPVACNFCFTSSLDGWDLWELARQNDYLGFDIYAIGRWDRNGSGLDVLRSAAAAHGKPAYILEYHAGPNNWAPVVDAQDMYVATFQAFAREVRLLTYYHWRPGSAGREQGIHGMTDSAGRPTERVTAAAECASFAQQVAHYLHGSRTAADVAMLFSIPSRFRDVGLGKANNASANKALTVWKHMERLRIQSTFIEERQILRGDLKDYRVLVLPGTPMLSQSAGQRVAEFARAGGAVVIYPGTAIVNELGFPHEAAPAVIGPAAGVRWTGERASASGKLRCKDPGMGSAPFEGELEKLAMGEGVEVIAQVGDVPAVVRAKLGKGHLTVFAFWPDVSLPKEGVGDPRVLRLVRTVLRSAGAQPHVEVFTPSEANALGERSFLETRMVQAAGSDLVFLANRSKEPLQGLRLGLRGAAGIGCYLLTPVTRQVLRLEAYVAGGRTYVTVPKLGAAGLIVRPRCSQPLLGMTARESVARGGRTRVEVTLDNFSSQPAPTTLSLSAPAGWKVTAEGPTRANVPPGGRGQALFWVDVPPDCTVDRFRLDHVLSARAQLGPGGPTLLCRQGVAVLPALDVAVMYEQQQLNPHQELSPPLLRWGWGTDVLAPPPPALPLRVPATVLLKVTPAPTVSGHMVLSGEGLRVTPERLAIPGGPADVPVTVWGLRSGSTTLTIAPEPAGAFDPVRVPVRVEVTPASLAQLKAPSDGVAVGVASGRAQGDLVTVDAPAHVNAVVGPKGEPLPVERDRGRVSFPVTLGPDQTAVYRLVHRPAPVAPLFTYVPVDAHTVAVRCSLYELRFDRSSGSLAGLRVAGRELLRSGHLVVVGTDQRTAFSQRHGHQCESLSVDCSALRARVVVKGGLAPAEADGAYEIVYDATPGRVSVRLKLANRGKAPVRYHHARFLVARAPDTTVQTGPAEPAADRRLLVNRNLRRYRDLAGPDGVGVGWLVEFARTRWGDDFAGWAEAPGWLRLDLKGVAALDPGQALDCQFHWVPHRGPRDIIELLAPRLVTRVGAGE